MTYQLYASAALFRVAMPPSPCVLSVSPSLGAALTAPLPHVAPVIGAVCELVYRQTCACAAPFPDVANVQRKDCPKCTFLSPQRTLSVHNLAAYLLPTLLDAEMPVALGVGMPVSLDVGIREADGKDGGGVE